MQTNMTPCHAIVSTPLQYLNVIEATHALNLEIDTLILADSVLDISYYEPLPLFKRWQSYELRTYQGEHKGKTRIRLGALARYYSHRKQSRPTIKRLRNCNVLLIGNIRKLLHRHMAASIRAKRLIICDDGAASAGLNGHGNVSLNQPPIHRYCCNVLGLHTGPIPGAELFSAYEAQQESSENFHLNRYEFLKKIISDTLNTETGKAWFLGQPVYDIPRPLAPFHKYLSYLKNIQANSLSQYNIAYYAHPRETSKTLAAIKEATGWETFPYDGPIELKLATASSLPERVFAMCSSAIQTIVTMFGNRIPVTILDIPKVFYGTDPSRALHIASIYRQLRSLAKPPHHFVDAQDIEQNMP
ncbi:hypothetical protein [Roseimaritima sediminicola]|uniref:hypothetical protein n=1 Tax=Roseimaritima sediminicola TaxID=2662066 RepID=UPI00129833F3|nr:hypothetical protein [Roseimaritima sediminicola]